MHSNRVARWACVALLVAVVVWCESATTYAYETWTGMKPEGQSMRTVTSQTKGIEDFTGICAEATGRCAEIADILQAGINEQYGVLIPIQELDDVSNTYNQIILGVISNPTIAGLASLHKQNVIDLGDEGYTLISLPNAYSTSGAWRILIVAADTKGVFRGAESLLDLIYGPPATIGDYRVRDYPDHQFRGLMHWIPLLSGTMDAYVNARKAEFRELADFGCNTLLLGNNDWWHWDDALDGFAKGIWMYNIAKAARYYGIEPVPEIYPLPYQVGRENIFLREGEYVHEEPFVVVSHGQGGYKLTPLIPPFDNAASNLDFETSSGGWPADWTLSGDFSYDGHSITHTTSSTFSLIREWSDMSLFQPRGFYVLEATYANAPSCVNLRFFAKNSYGRCAFFGNFERFFDGTYVKDLFFLTPPLNAASAPAGYNAARDSFTSADQKFENYPYFEEIVSMHLMIDNIGEGSSAEGMRLNGFFLERRESSLRNVMKVSPDQYLAISDDGLPFTIKNARTQTICNPDSQYTLNYVPPNNFLMRTHEYPSGNEAVSSIAWWDTTMLNDTMLVSYTLGVPNDWSGEGQRTRYCMSSAALYRRMAETLEDLYTDFAGPGTAINPKYIDIRNDEMRGINRCGRCEAAGKTNALHLIDYIKNVQLILDNIASQPEHSAAGATSLICSSDMLNPCHNGGQEQYQYVYGGPWGATAGELHELAGTNAKLIIQNSSGPYSKTARDKGWPGSEAGGANVRVLATLLPETLPHYDYDVPEFLAKMDTWYLSDCLGFSSVAVFDTQHAEAEHRWLDYGWKRYKHPDATMHEYRYGLFVTDDTGGHLTEIPSGSSLDFAPFGNAEVRDPALGAWMVTEAKINWGSGSPEDVLSKLNESLVTHQFNVTTTTTYNVTLNVKVDSSGVLRTQTAVIPVKVRSKDGEPIPIDPSSQSPDKGVPFGMKSIAPNPFNPVTTIQFGLPRTVAVQLTVYDVQGREVKRLIDGEKVLAGLHTIAWNGKSERGSQVASGIYFVRLVAEGQMQTRKVVLMR